MGGYWILARRPYRQSSIDFMSFFASAAAYAAVVEVYAKKYEIKKSAADFAETERPKPSASRYR